MGADVLPHLAHTGVGRPMATIENSIFLRSFLKILLAGDGDLTWIMWSKQMSVDPQQAQRSALRSPIAISWDFRRNSKSCHLLRMMKFWFSITIHDVVLLEYLITKKITYRAGRVSPGMGHRSMNDRQRSTSLNGTSSYRWPV